MLIFLVSWAIGIPALGLFGYWMHTWPEHAWSEAGFWRYLWRKLRRRT